MADVKPIPDDYPQVTPYLCVDGADAAIRFYREVFGATERMRMGGEPGDPPEKVGHAELQVGAGLIMLSDEFPALGIRGPRSIGGTPVTISVYVDDVDATFERALARGAVTLRPVADQFYGDRTGQFEDPFGHRWSVATHVEDVSPEEMERRAAAMGEPGGG
ncbi:MAG TPA: VOC family protein [Acidimicrobiales bacterium]|nr:VOC family protein [Acidimicrobiales bacterium]